MKPYFMKHLFAKLKFHKIIYLDSDILILNPLQNALKLLDEYDILLTPHIDKDYPEDMKTPSDFNILKVGVYNSGFIALNNTPNALSFLNWWQEKLRNKCFEDFTRGYFVCQKILDLAPALFNKCHILREPGYNVGPWNLHCRQVKRRSGVWTCSDQDLYFFHFSGYSLKSPETISINQDRYQMTELPELRELFNIYRNHLLEKGAMESGIWPYSFNYFKNGRRISGAMRVIYREILNNTPKQASIDPFNDYQFFYFRIVLKWVRNFFDMPRRHLTASAIFLLIILILSYICLQR